MHPYLLASALLRYPDAELLAARDELAATARAMPSSPGIDELRHFSAWWAARHGDRLQMLYVETFDFARRTGLDLTYYTHGDRRQRGLALLALRRRYGAAGLDLDTEELPDHLPLVLEFAAVTPDAGAEVLAEYRTVIELLHLALERAGSPFAAVLRGLCLLLAPLTPEEGEQVRRMALDGPPDEEVGLAPFAPPEIMPEPRRRPAVRCGAAVGGER
jgi:nitrate reductase molybdenum cofactor assembly chaperone NarJ/NarW